MSLKLLVLVTFLVTTVFMIADVSALSVNMTMPENGNISASFNITFGCNATDENLANLTLHVWDYYTVPYYQNTVSVTGVFNESNWTLNDMPSGDYIWNCMAYDNESNTAWSATNRSVHVNLFYLAESSAESDKTYTVAAADLDGDGDIDYISGNYNQPNRVYMNNGTGSFTLYETGSGSYGTVHIAIADFDNDGDADYLEGNFQQDNRLYLNNGSGNFIFSENVSSPGTENTQSIAVADFDNDGDLDFAVANSQGSISLQIFENDGNAHFTSRENISEQNLHSVAAGDVNGDGYTDIVAAGQPNQATKVYYNNGTGYFTSSYSFSASALFSEDLSLVDLDNDGYLDVIEGVNRDFQETRVFINDGTGQFSAVDTFGNTNETYYVVTGDTDNDGDADAIVGNYEQKNFIYINNGTGTFRVFESVSSGFQTFSVIFADLDNDGDLDFIEGNNNAGNGVYLNKLNDNNYIKVRVMSSSTNVNMDAVGTKVELANSTGDFLGYREVTAADTTQDGVGQLHFGVPSGSTYTINATFITGAIVSCIAQPSDSFTMYENGSSTGGVSCSVVDYKPEIIIMTPEDGNVSINNTVNFTCNVSDDNMLGQITLYVWNSTSLYYQDTNSISGTANSSYWLLQNMVTDSYMWSCRACDNASQCTGINSSLSILVKKRLRLKLILNTTGASVYIPDLGEMSTSSLSYMRGNPSHFFAVSFLDGVTSGIIAESGVPRLLMAAEMSGGKHYIGIDQDIAGSRSLLVFTGGGWRAVDDRKEAVESGDFLKNIKPSFSFGLGKELAEMALEYSNIDLTGILKFGKGSRKVTIENNGSYNGRTVLEISS